MQSARQLNSLRKTIPLRGAFVGKRASTKAQPSRLETTEVDGGDFRPPWVYSGARFLTYTTIPLTLFYCAFLADWGDREHIFMPLRRWASEYKQSILSLSPEEAALVRGSDRAQASGNISPPSDKRGS